MIYLLIAPALFLGGHLAQALAENQGDSNYFLQKRDVGYLNESIIPSVSETAYSSEVDFPSSFTDASSVPTFTPIDTIDISTPAQFVDVVLSSILGSLGDTNSYLSGEVSLLVESALQKFADALGESLSLFLNVFFGDNLSDSSTSLEKAIEAFTAITASLNSWYLLPTYLDFLENIKQLSLLENPSLIESSIRSALAPLIEAAKTAIEKYASESVEFAEAVEDFQKIIYQMIYEALEVLYQNSKSSSEYDLVYESEVSLGSESSIKISSDLETYSYSQFQSDAEPSLTIEGELEFPFPEPTPEISSSSLPQNSSTIVTTVTKYTTIVKTDGTVTITVTEPCETLIETLVVDHKTTYTVTTSTSTETGIVFIEANPSTKTITESCPVCKTYTKVESALTVYETTSGNVVVTVTEPCETTYTVVEYPVTSEIYVVTETVTKTDCVQCKTHYSTVTSLVTYTTASSAETTTVTEPLTQVHTIIETPVTSGGSLVYSTLTVYSTLAASIPVTVLTKTISSTITLASVSTKTLVATGPSSTYTNTFVETVSQSSPVSSTAIVTTGFSSSKTEETDISVVTILSFPVSSSVSLPDTYVATSYVSSSTVSSGTVISVWTSTLWPSSASVSSLSTDFVYILSLSSSTAPIPHTESSPETVPLSTLVESSVGTVTVLSVPSVSSQSLSTAYSAETSSTYFVSSSSSLESSQSIGSISSASLGSSQSALSSVTSHTLPESSVATSTSISASVPSEVPVESVDQVPTSTPEFGITQVNVGVSVNVNVSWIVLTLFIVLFI